jgi:tetratricopeptide (TPR) repeat protein
MAEVQIAAADNQEFISLPLVASVFGKKKLNISPFKAAVQSDVEILRMLGPTRFTDIHLSLAKRLESFIANVSRRVEAGASFESYSPILEMICRAYNPGWLLLARWHMENRTTEGYAKAKEELKRFLENDPSSDEAAEAWRMLAQACFRTGDALGEIHAFIERAQITSVPFYDVSNTANRLNELLRSRQLEIDRDEKRALAQRIVTALDSRRVEAAAADYSRMAWLAIHLGQEDKAREYAEAGLALEPDHYHSGRVLERLNRR